MKNILTLAMLCALAFGITPVAFAQEMNDAEDIDTVEFEGELEYTLTDGEVTAEDIEDAEEVTEADIDDELVTGEVVAVTESYVVLENEEGELVKVATTLSNEAQRRRGGSIIRMAQVTFGNRVALVPTNGDAVTGTNPVVGTDEVTIQTPAGVVTLPKSDNFKIVAGGDTVATAMLTRLDDADNVTLITNEDGEVLGLHITGEDTLDADSPSEETELVLDTEDEGGFPWGWAIAVVVLLLLIMMFRRK